MKDNNTNYAHTVVLASQDNYAHIGRHMHTHDIYYIYNNYIYSVCILY